MISAEEEIHQTVEGLERMYRSLLALREEMLARSPQWYALMAEGPLEQVRRLQAQLDECTGAGAARRMSVDLWLSVTGPETAQGEIPVRSLVDLLDVIQRGYVSVYSFLAGKRLPGSGSQPPAELWVSDGLSGRLEVGLTLSPHLESEIPAEELTAEELTPEETRGWRALTDILAAARWAASDQLPATLEAQFPDAAYRRVLLDAVTGLIPTDPPQTVSLCGRAIPDGKTIALSSTTLRRIQDAVGPFTAPAGIRKTA